MSNVVSSALKEDYETAFSVQAIVSQSWRLFTQCWLSHLGLAVVCYVPFIAFVAFLIQQKPAGQWGEDVPMLIALGLFLLGHGLGSSIRIHMVGSQLRGETPSVIQSTKALLPRLVIILIVWFVSLFAGLLSLSFLVIPGIVFGAYFLAVTPAQILENLGPVASFRRSVALTAKQRFEIFGLFITTYTLTLTTLFIPILIFFDSIWRAVAFHRLRIAKGEMMAQPSAAQRQ